MVQATAGGERLGLTVEEEERAPPGGPRHLDGAPRQGVVVGCQRLHCGLLGRKAGCQTAGFAGPGCVGQLTIGEDAMAVPVAETAQRLLDRSDEREIQTDMER